MENAINIRFNITEEKVSFICKNHSKTPEGITSEKKGLGLLLIKKRLDLIYKMDYHLNIEEEDNWYIVNLEIPLNDH